MVYDACNDTNLLHSLPSVYSVTVPLHVSGLLVAHHQEVTMYIQGESGGMCNTLGNDSVCDSKQKSSYEHGSDFERLPRVW
jgi:hypothetical protein